MQTEIDKVYVLKVDELAVLAAAKDINQIVSIQDQENLIDEKRICKILNSLYLEQIIYNAENESFILETELNEMMINIKNSKDLVIVREFAGDIQIIKSIYIAEKIVVLEQNSKDLSRVKIYISSIMQLQLDIKTLLMNKKEEKIKILDEEGVMLDFIKKKRLLQDYEIKEMGNVVAIIEKLSIHNNVMFRMIVKSEQIYRNNMKTPQSILKLEEEKFLSEFNKLLEGGLNDIS